MKNKNIIISAVLLVLIIIFVVVYSSGRNQPVKKAVVNSGNSSLTSVNDTSDAAIQKDFSNLSKQLDTLNADTATIDQVMPQ